MSKIHPDPGIQNLKFSVFSQYIWSESRSAPLILYVCICSTTTAEALESQAKLQEHSTEILQSNHVHSVLLRELIGRQEELISGQKELISR